MSMTTEPQLLRTALAVSALAFAVGCSGGESDDDDGITPARDGGVAVRDAGPEPECTTNAECTGALPYCNPLGACAEPPRGGAIGWGDGSATSVDFEVVYTAPRRLQTPDLEFHPNRAGELWLVHREFKSSQTCTQSQRGGCASLEGSTTTITNVGTANQEAEWKRDDNAWHFMRRPPALAFGDNGNFATCGEERTGNFLDGQPTFIGPSLWSSDPAVYAVTPPGGNGSHLDMLHESPYCVGVAHEQDNVYWVFNGEIGALDRYDFADDHGPGADDHSDGVLYRYAEGMVSRVAEVPSHMAYNPDTGFLYVADTGNSRIVVLDTMSGTRAGGVTPMWEPLADDAVYEDALVVELVAPGMLDQPSGLELHDGLLYVTDAAQSRFYVFDLQGNVVRTLDTEVEAGELGGIAISPEGDLYFALLSASEVYRISPR